MSEDIRLNNDVLSIINDQYLNIDLGTKIEGMYAIDCAFSNNGDYIAIVDMSEFLSNYKVHIMNTDGWEIIKTIDLGMSGNQFRKHHCTFTNDDKYLIVLGGLSSIKIYDVGTWSLSKTIPQTYNINKFALSDDDRYLAVSYYAPDDVEEYGFFIRIYDMVSFKDHVIMMRNTSDTILISFVFSSNSEYIIVNMTNTTNGGNYIYVIGHRNNTIVKSINILYPDNLIEMRVFGDRLLCCDSKSNMFEWDIETGDRLQHINLETNLDKAYVSKDGRYLYLITKSVSGKISSELEIWEINTWTNLTRRDVNPDKVSFDNDYRYLAVINKSYEIIVWDILNEFKNLITV